MFLVGDAKYDKDERWRLGQVEQIISPTRLLIRYHLTVTPTKQVEKFLERRPRQVSLITKCKEPGTHSLELLKSDSCEDVDTPTHSPDLNVEVISPSS